VRYDRVDKTYGTQFKAQAVIVWCMLPSRRVKKGNGMEKETNIVKR